MRIYIIKNLKYLRYAATLTLGFILGVTLINIFIAKEIDRLYMENYNLQEEITAKEEEVKELKNSLDERRFTITSIEVDVTLTENSMTEYEKDNISFEIERKIKEILGDIIGNEVDEVDYSMVSKIIDERIMEVDGKKFEVKTDLIIATQKLTVYVKTKNLSEEEA